MNWYFWLGIYVVLFGTARAWPKSYSRCVQLLFRLLARSMKRFGLVIAVTALSAAGLFGAMFITSWVENDWHGVCLGGAGLATYGGISLLLAAKLLAGTWGMFCDSMERELFHRSSPNNITK